MAGRSLPPGRHTTFNLFATTRLRGRYGGNDISDVMFVNPYPLCLNHFLSIVQVHAHITSNYVYLFDCYLIIKILNIWYYRMRGELRVFFFCNNIIENINYFISILTRIMFGLNQFDIQYQYVIIRVIMHTLSKGIIIRKNRFPLL